jgi:dipeptidyl aminopeptidase/acylaminoacyl peptidase
MSKKMLLLVTLLLAACPILLMAQDAAKTASALTVETAVCTGVTDREPVGTADNFAAEVGKVFVWCKITGAAAGSAVTLVWSHAGKEMARVELKVNGSPWRTWSSKTIAPSWTGNWEVKVLGPDGAEVKAANFTIGGQAEKK